MSNVQPVVRHLIPCEEVLVDEANPRRVSIVGLISAIRSVEGRPFPLRYRELCVFVQLTSCRGPAECRVEIRHADSDAVVFRSQPRVIQLPTDPLEVTGIAFRIRDCLYQQAGLYWVQFWYMEEMLFQQPLLLR